MKIGIIGASISGLAIAGELIKQGHQVTLYEQHTECLKNQGAGIIIPVSLFSELEKKNIFRNIISIPVSQRNMIGSNNSRGRTICSQSFSACALHWQAMYAELRANVPDENIKTYRVTNVDDIRREGGYDLVIGADGHNSLTAKTISSSIKTEYAGYIAWRGTVYLKDCVTNGIFGSKQESYVPYFLYDDGHCVLYLISDPETNETLINWVLYQKRTDNSLNGLLSMNSNTMQYRTMPRGEMKEDQKKYLHAFIKVLPKIAQDIIIKTHEPFIQPVYTIQVPRRINQDGNVIVIGDAAGTLPPHTASGATRGLSDALLLAGIIRNNGLEGLKEWANRRLAEDNNLHNLSNRMKDFLVLNSPDWRNMTSTQFEKMWAKVLAGEQWYTSNTTKPEVTKAKL